jgi:hypothetical protein
MTPSCGQAKKPGMKRRRLLIGVVVLACLSMVALVVAFVRVCAREVRTMRILAVNAAHVLPPEKNAATLYDELVLSDVFTGSSDHLNLTPAAYVKLVKASSMDACWFPLLPSEQCYPEHWKRNGYMQYWILALESAAQSDVAAGRYAAAAEKLQCLVRMAGHLQQQLLWPDFQMGMGMEKDVWLRLAEGIMQADTAEELLRVVEAMPPDKLVNQGKQAYAQVLEVSALIPKSVPPHRTIRQRLTYWWERLRESSNEEDTQKVYGWLLWRRRGTRILAGLRRYHDANGRWPESLDDIRPLVPEQALIDPYTGQTFVYRKVPGGEFLLYARGPNKLDDNGSHTGTADDCRTWPLRDRMPAAEPNNADKP